MDLLTIGGAKPAPETQIRHIYCPSLVGLSARLADAAFLIPRMDQNKQATDNNGYGHWAATVAADPFGSTSSYFSALREANYTGVVNWPSSILLEGHTQQQMSTIPATPSAEYAYLAMAQRNGFETLGFILTPDHASAALAAGIKDLILHPGILLDVDSSGAHMIRRSLESIILAIKRLDKDAKIFLYTSDWHDETIGLSNIACDGFVRFEEVAA